MCLLADLFKNFEPFPFFIKICEKKIVYCKNKALIVLCHSTFLGINNLRLINFFFCKINGNLQWLEKNDKLIASLTVRATVEYFL